MSDVAVFPVRGLSARHCNEQSLVSLDHLDVVYHELFIDGDGHHRFHLAFLLDFSDSHVRNLHRFCPPLVPSLQYIPFVVLGYNPNTVVAAVIGVRLECITALDNAVLNMCVVADINIIQNDGILNHTILPDKYLLEQDRILHLAVDDASAGD